MSTEVNITGMQELLDKLEAMGRKGASIENEALRAAADPVAKDMKSLVKVSTTNHMHIRDDIEISKIKTKAGVRFIEIGPGIKTNWRAKFLEFGTSKASAHPFIQPAFEKNKRNVIEIIKNKLREGLGL